jgi:zeta-carotene desaturase
MGVADRIEFHRDFFFIEPGGRVSTLKRGLLPAPMHFAESFARMRCFSLPDKLAIGRGLLAIRRERLSRADLDQISMLDWLVEKKQTPGAIEHFWGPVLVSAVNEELGRMAARHAFQVLWLGFLARADGYEMGIPGVALRELYDAAALERIGNVSLEERASVERIDSDGMVVTGVLHTADYYISALPFERLAVVAPDLRVQKNLFDHSPITGIHLWFDRSITELPYATLLGRTLQWMFNKSGGEYVQFVVSASREVVSMSREAVIALALTEAGDYFPVIREARLLRAHVVKEVRATFSAAPGTEALRPGTATGFPKIFLAGDWTRSGWPATMEGAVRSGYLAAEAVTAAAGCPTRFLLPDVA